MLPALQTNDLVVAYRQADYQIGDVVIYQKLGGFVVHRIVEETEPGEFVTRGINNSNADSWGVASADIQGRLLLVIPQFGALFVLLSTNPLFAGFAGVLVAAFVLFPTRSAKPSPRLQELLKHSAHETRHIKPLAAMQMSLLWILVIASVTASVLEIIYNLPLYPQLALSLVAVLVAFALLVGFWEFKADGRGLPEPMKSIAVLGPVLHRVPPEASVSGTELETVEVTSAFKLRNIKERTRLPVLHQIDVATSTHKFFVVTESKVFQYSVVANQSQSRV